MTLMPHSHSRIAALASLGAALLFVAAPASAGIGAEDDAAPSTPIALSDSGCAGTDAVFAALPVEEPSADDAFAAQQAAAAQGTETSSDDRSTGRAG